MEIILKEEENKVSLIAKITVGSIPIKTVVEQDWQLQNDKNHFVAQKDQKGLEIDRDLNKLDCAEYHFW